MDDTPTSVTDDASAETNLPPSPLAPKPVRSGWRTAESIWFGLAWCTVAVLAWVTFTRLFDVTFPARVTVLLQALLPFVYLPAYVFGVTAFVRRRWVLGGACALLAVAHLVALYPAVGSHPTPAWAATAPTFTVFESNIYDHNPTPDKAAARVMATNADVLVIVEMTPRMYAAFDAAGVNQRYPYSVRSSTLYTINNVIWSKTPITDPDLIKWGPRVYEPVGTVTVGGRPIQITGVHVDNSLHGRIEWRAEMSELQTRAHATSMPAAIVGDFNATRWNPPFAKLLDGGLTDAHEAVGRGLSMSWPNRGFPIRLMRLDHAVVNDRVAPLSVRDIDVPGSDHRGFIATLAVGQ